MRTANRKWGLLEAAEKYTRYPRSYADVPTFDQRELVSLTRRVEMPSEPGKLLPFRFDRIKRLFN